jgi:5-methylcytosine-specific restriction endonuclease McrA
VCDSRLERVIAISKDKFPHIWQGDLRKCSRCDIFKELSNFPVYIAKRARVSSMCYDCKRDADRRNSKLTKEERTVARILREKTREEMRLTAKKRKQKRSIAYRNKKKETGWSKSISLCICVDCGKYQVLRKGGVNDWMCGMCKQRRFRIRITKPYNGTCKVCNNDYTHQTHTGLYNFCSVICRDKRKRDRAKVAASRRDALKRGVTVAANVSRNKVFKRDKHRCNHCKIKVQVDTPLLDDSAELDHIVPLSKGGPHTYSNVQTLCRKCNADKSNNYAGQLVMMI